MYTTQGPHTKSLKKALGIFEERFGKGSFDSNKKPTSKVENLTNKVGENSARRVNSGTTGGTNGQGVNDKKEGGATLESAFDSLDKNMKEKMKKIDDEITVAKGKSDALKTDKLIKAEEANINLLTSIEKELKERQKGTRQDLMPQLT